VVPNLQEMLAVERRLRIREELRITRTRREARHAATVMLKAEQVSVERFDDAADGPSTSLED
jgi:stress response protein YsnF